MGKNACGARAISPQKGEIAMTETVDKLASLEGKAVELIEKFESIAEQHGPQAIELGLDAVRIIGLQSVIGHVVFLFIGLGCIYTARKIWVYMKNWNPEDHNGHDLWFDFWPIGPFVIFCVGIFGFGGVLMIRLFNIWGWVALFYPELWLVGKLFR